MLHLVYVYHSSAADFSLAKMYLDLWNRQTRRSNEVIFVLEDGGAKITYRGRAFDWETEEAITVALQSVSARVQADDLRHQYHEAKPLFRVLLEGSRNTDNRVIDFGESTGFMTSLFDYVNTHGASFIVENANFECFLLLWAHEFARIRLAEAYQKHDQNRF